MQAVGVVGSFPASTLPQYYYTCVVFKSGVPVAFPGLLNTDN